VQEPAGRRTRFGHAKSASVPSAAALKSIMTSRWPERFMYGVFGLTPPAPAGGREAKARQFLEAKAAAEDAVAVISYFNACLAEMREPWFMPTIRGAIVAGHPWMIVGCRSCDTVIDFDLRMKPRKPDATILLALAEVACPRCNGHGRPQIMRLARHPSFTSTLGWRD
jgi:hypothetical protein